MRYNYSGSGARGLRVLATILFVLSLLAFIMGLASIYLMIDETIPTIIGGYMLLGAIIIFINMLVLSFLVEAFATMAEAAQIIKVNNDEKYAHLKSE